MAIGDLADGTIDYLSLPTALALVSPPPPVEGLPAVNVATYQPMIAPIVAPEQAAYGIPLEAGPPIPPPLPNLSDALFPVAGVDVGVIQLAPVGVINPAPLPSVEIPTPQFESAASSAPSAPSAIVLPRSTPAEWDKASPPPSPTVTPASHVAVAVDAPPWMWIGGAAAVGLGAFLFLRKKKRK